jgi:hypothetical protein
MKMDNESSFEDSVTIYQSTRCYPTSLVSSSAPFVNCECSRECFILFRVGAIQNIFTICSCIGYVLYFHMKPGNCVTYHTEPNIILAFF